MIRLRVRKNESLFYHLHIYIYIYMGRIDSSLMTKRGKGNHSGKVNSRIKTKVFSGMKHLLSYMYSLTEIIKKNLFRKKAYSWHRHQFSASLSLGCCYVDSDSGICRTSACHDNPTTHRCLTTLESYSSSIFS